MRPLLLAGVLLVCLNAPASAALSPRDLASVGAAPPAGARLPREALARDIEGRRLTIGAAIGGKPAVVIFADYRCVELCSPILGVAARALNDTGLTPGADFRLMVIGFNPAADADDARRMADGQIGLGTPLGRATAVLLPTPGVAVALARDAGFSYLYDADAGRYAHAVSLFVLTPDGRLSRVLSGLAVEPQSLRAAIVDARSGELGVIEDQLHVLCYGLAAGVGRYAGEIRTAIWGSGAATLLALGAGLIYLIRREYGARS